MKTKYLLTILLLGFIFLSGCTVSDVQDNLKKGSGFFTEMKISIVERITGNQEQIDEVKDLKESIESGNPVFSSEETIAPQGDLAIEMNNLVKPALDKVFSEEKLIYISDATITPLIMKYVVKKRIERQDADAVYSEIKNSIRTFRKEEADNMPSYDEAKKAVRFAVNHEFGGRTYLVEVTLDLSSQEVWVNVYLI